MRTIGLLGGMSWESTAAYYRAINEGVKTALGGLHSAQIVLVSVDFDPIEKLQNAGDWDTAAAILITATRRLQAAGAEAVMICTNTMHKVAPQIAAAISIPLLHIADATGEALVAKHYTRVALLGTAFTMEQGFYKNRLAETFGLEVIVPNDTDRQIVHRIIYEELCLGQIKPRSRDEYLRIIEQMSSDGAQAIILGCTEIGLLVNQADTAAPLLDTTIIHTQQAVDFLLS